MRLTNQEVKVILEAFDGATSPAFWDRADVNALYDKIKRLQERCRVCGSTDNLRYYKDGLGPICKNCDKGRTKNATRHK